jgi:hypothetical protein
LGLGLLWIDDRSRFRGNRFVFGLGEFFEGLSGGLLNGLRLGGKQLFANAHNAKCRFQSTQLARFEHLANHFGSRFRVTACLDQRLLCPLANIELVRIKLANRLLETLGRHSRFRRSYVGWFCFFGC